MPQMSPMNWLILFIMFTIVFIMFNMMNYFLFMPPKMKYNYNKLFNNSMIWKW